jgi:hypothetical protein
MFLSTNVYFFILCFIEFKVNFSETLNCRYHSKWQGKDYSQVKKQTALQGNRAVGYVADLRPIARFLGGMFLGRRGKFQAARTLPATMNLGQKIFATIILFLLF